MYKIISKTDGTFVCVCEVQDGREQWIEKDRFTAIQSLIRAARLNNGSYITETDILFVIDISPIANHCNADKQLLESIQSGRKVVLDFNDKRIKYGITDAECELILGIREGEYVVSKRNF